MFASIVLPLALAAGSLAMPMARQNSCTNLGAGATASLTYNFTLSAVSPTAADSATGTNLLVTPGPAGTSGEAVDYWLSTFSGTGSSNFPTFTLEDGALIPQPNAANQDYVAWDTTVEAGKYIDFTVTDAIFGGSNEATPYCAVSDASGFVTLAANGVSNGFSLCATTNDNYVLVFQASSTNDGSYQYNTCQPQNIHLVQA
ncbi:uncharacterized protein C8Q71DRAFT_713219 [Rhodofomes roseus]|uniref:Uncharacterized protein n=1 Tax=Rhodofomes roseus TaxID=34475 RepID=A0ABQ8K802_9APHY|nr:uncharacterized protein C8Q71DRAFT_713219 [Rhodofomes roseus]KAH9833318.1 hypothetical protein C8Q71DRAFT_713219 [Rhodofomes roseus]